MHKLVLLLLFCVFFTTNSVSQIKDADLINYTQKDGLPSNETYYILRDSKDYLWIATDQGVVRFNGNKMEKFELPDNVVFKMKEDAEGKIWFFTSTGNLFYFLNERIFTFKFNKIIQDSLKRIIILDAIFRNNELTINTLPYLQFTINTDNGKLSQFQFFDTLNLYKKRIYQIDQSGPFKNSIQCIYANGNYVDSLQFDFLYRSNTVRYVIKCKRQTYFRHYSIVNHNEARLINAGKSLLRIDKDGNYLLKDFENEILCLQVDSLSNTLWVGFLNGGVKKLNLNDFSNPLDVNTLEGLSISSFATDFEGGLWISTLEKGIFYLNKNNHQNKFKGAESVPVLRMLPLDSSNLIFATTLGLYNTNADKKTTQISDVKNKGIYDIKFHNRNLLVTGNMFPPFIVNADYKANYRKLAINTITNLYGESEFLNITDTMFMWKVGIKIVEYHFNENEYSFPYTIPENGLAFIDDEKRIWSGSLHNLYKYNNLKKSFIPLSTPSGIFSKGITNIKQLANKLLVVGIRFGGIAIIKDTTVIVGITEKNGILDNSIKYILPDGNRLWIATPKGISAISFTSYNPVTYTIKNFGEEAGFSDMIISQLIKFNGNILAATSKGIFEIPNVDKLLSEKPLPIPFYITTISTYRGDTSNLTSLSVPYKNSRVSIKFNALIFNSPKTVRYFYRIIETDATWYSIDNTELVLQNLPAGRYNIEFKAESTKQGRISSIQKLTIIVEKPWWQKNGIIAAGLLILLGSVYTYYRFRITKITKREQEKNRIQTRVSELEQIALRLQMNPHFIFNCLTSIQQLIATGNKDDATKYLVKFSRLIRNTLEISTKQFITIADEIAYLTEYLTLEQLRITGKMVYKFTLDEQINISKTEIPNMTIQPIVENAIRHGIKALEDRKGEINIEIKSGKGEILCIVTDNGIGRIPEAKKGLWDITGHKSYGLNIVKQRLEGLSGNEDVKYFIEIIDLHNDKSEQVGTKVILHLPFKVI